MSPGGTNPEGSGGHEKLQPSLDKRLEIMGQEIQGQSVFFDLTYYLPHLEGITIGHLVRKEGNELSPADEQRLKRMMALHVKGKVLPRKTADEQRFWYDIEDWAGAEIDRADAFTDDLSDMPKSWQPAHNSLIKLQNTLKAQRGES